MNLFEYIGYALGVISFISGVGTVIYTKNREYLIRLQEQEKKALMDSNDRLQDENKEYKSRIDNAEHKVKFLQDETSGRADFKLLSEQMARDNGAIVKQLSGVASELAKLTKVIVEKET